MNKKLLIPIIILLVIAVAYLDVSIYFTGHFMFNTTLNGADVSCFSSEKVHQSWEDNINAYQLVISGRDNQKSVLKGRDINLTLNWDDSVHQLIKAQKPYNWLISLFKPTELTCSTIVSYDEEKYNAALNELTCMSKKNQIMPVDATISEYSETDGFTLVPSIPGTAINRESFSQGVSEKIYGLQNSYIIADEGGYIEPEIKDDNEELIDLIDKKNNFSSAKITFDLGDDSFVLDAGVYGDWLVLNKKGDLKLDHSKVEEYVNELAAKYNTIDKPKNLQTSYGSAVTITNVHYGWEIDTETEISTIIDEIENSKVETRDLNYLQTANSHGENDYGNSYVEVNLTSQHLYLYKDGEMVLESDFVSGNVAKGNGTPGGAFGITYAARNAVLKGDDYETPVAYWMPFNGGIGLHDAYWRGAFGGSIYKYGGSHGCVNLPTSVAKEIFEVVSKNYPVLVYELEGTESTTTTPSAITSAPFGVNKNKTDDKKTDDKKKDSKKKDSKKKDSKKKTSDKKSDSKKKDSKKKDSKKKDSKKKK